MLILRPIVVSSMTPWGGSMRTMPSASTLSAPASSLCPPGGQQTMKRSRCASPRRAGPGLRKVFHTVPSWLICHQLRERIYDDRLDLVLGGTFLVTLPRARATRDGPHLHVVNYHHVIHSLRKSRWPYSSLLAALCSTTIVCRFIGR